MRKFTTRINWQFAVGELFLIITGILIALGIDSWAERRADQATVDAYLSDLVLELRSDVTILEAYRTNVDDSVALASRLLTILQGEGDADSELGNLLLGTLFSDEVTPESVIWEQLRTTGALHLIESHELKTAIVGYYLYRSTSFETIDDNFSPAVRAMRALAWDIMPVQAFPTYFESGRVHTGVPNELVLAGLRRRDDSEFQLKRFITTGTVARVNLSRVLSHTEALLKQLSP